MANSAALQSLRTSLRATVRLPPNVNEELGIIFLFGKIVLLTMVTGYRARKKAPFLNEKSHGRSDHPMTARRKNMVLTNEQKRLGAQWTTTQNLLGAVDLPPEPLRRREKMTNCERRC